MCLRVFIFFFHFLIILGDGGGHRDDVAPMLTFFWVTGHRLHKKTKQIISNEKKVINMGNKLTGACQMRHKPLLSMLGATA